MRTEEITTKGTIFMEDFAAIVVLPVPAIPLSQYTFVVISSLAHTCNLSRSALRMFFVQALRGAGDATSYSTNWARGKSLSESASYGLTLSKDNRLSWHIHSLRFETSIVHFDANGSDTEDKNVSTKNCIDRMILTVLAMIGRSMYMWAPWKVKQSAFEGNIF